MIKIGKYNKELESYGYYCDVDIDFVVNKYTIYDLEGYRYIGVIDRFRSNKNKYSPLKFGKSNPHTIENISIFLDKHYSGIRLLKNQKYKGEFENLYLQCEKHGIIKSNWGYISKLDCGICKECGKEKQSASSRKSLDDTLYDFYKIHGNKYDYSKVKDNLTTSNKEVCIICPIHGEFWQTPNNHMNGQGCRKCCLQTIGSWNKKTEEKALNDLILKHGDKYDYSKFKYNGNRHDIIVICREHGEFIIKYGKHLSGQECQKCSWENKEHRGWSLTEWNSIGLNSKNFTGFKTYIIKCYNNDELFYKIGTTFNDLSIRFKSKNMPYNYEEISVYDFGTDSKSAWDLEKQLHLIHKEFHYIPNLKFNGSSRECFSTLI